MKKTTIVGILLMAVVATCYVVPADAVAQVSVRRTPRREATDKKDKKPTAGTASGANKATPASSTATKSKPAETPAPKRTPAATRSQQAAPAAAATTRGGKSVREQAFDDYQKRDDGNATWQHVVYRELDLTRGANASLYYPQEPVDDMTNLFRVIIELLATGQLRGYEYLDGREVFADRYAVKPQDLFDKFQIMYEKKDGVGRDAQPTYVIDESDVPSNEVLSYYIKEKWEFNQQTSQYGPRVLALCPVLHRAGDFGGDAVKYPMLWLDYEELRPYLRQHLIVSDGMNAAPRFTMEDFFALGQYKGDIYKVQNLRGLSLAQQYPDADSLRAAQARIEAELRGFEDGIWVGEEEEEAEASPRRHRGRDRQAEPADTVATRAKVNRRTRQAVDMDAVEAERDAKEREEDSRIRREGTARSVRRRR